MSYRTLVEATQLTGISTVEQYFAEVFSLKPGEVAHVQCKGNSSGTTDNVIFSIYTSPKLVPVAADYDVFPYSTFTITATSGGDVSKSVVLDGIRSFRVGVKSSSTNDTFTADLTVSLDGKDLY